jgi:hypothetical protein
MDQTVFVFSPLDVPASIPLILKSDVVAIRDVGMCVAIPSLDVQLDTDFSPLSVPMMAISFDVMLQALYGDVQLVSAVWQAPESTAPTSPGPIPPAVTDPAVVSVVCPGTHAVIRAGETASLRCSGVYVGPSITPLGVGAPVPLLVRFSLGDLHYEQRVVLQLPTRTPFVNMPSVPDRPLCGSTFVLTTTVDVLPSMLLESGSTLMVRGTNGARLQVVTVVSTNPNWGVLSAGGVVATMNVSTTMAGVTWTVMLDCAGMEWSSETLTAIVVRGDMCLLPYCCAASH